VQAATERVETLEAELEAQRKDAAALVADSSGLEEELETRTKQLAEAEATVRRQEAEALAWREAAEASRDPSLWARPINSDSSVDDETPPDSPQTIPDASLDASRAALLKHDTLAGGGVLSQSDIDAWTPRVAKLASKASKCVAPRREHGAFILLPVRAIRLTPRVLFIHSAPRRRLRRVDEPGVVRAVQEDPGRLT